MMIADQLAEEPLVPPRTADGQTSITAVGSRLTDLQQQARARIRQRPIGALLAAVGIGYVFARLVSRAMR